MSGRSMLNNNSVSSSGDELKRKYSELQEEHKALKEERDEVVEDLQNVENAFSDLHKKYERAKVTLENFKKNEDLLKVRDALFVKKLGERDGQLQRLREEIQQKLELMHSDYVEKTKELEAENVKLRALVRKNEMRVSTLESDLEQKMKENAQLHALCDDLINNSGRK